MAALVTDEACLKHLGTIVEDAHPRAVQYLLSILKSQKTDGVTVATLWEKFKGRNSPRQTAEQLLTGAKTLSSAVSFLQLADAIDSNYAAEVVVQMAPYVDKVRDLVAQSTGPVQVRFLLRCASRDKTLRRAAFGAESAVSRLRDRNRHSTATSTRLVIGLAKSVGVSIKELFAGYSGADWQRVISNSTVSGIRLLLYRLIVYKEKVLARALSEALCRCDVTELVNKGDATVYRLYGLIGNINWTAPLFPIPAWLSVGLE